ncbi:MAG: hypothetical protein ACOC9R_01505 [bacterium]
MAKTVKELVGEAVKSALDEQLKPISDRLDKLEKPDGGGSGNGGAGKSGDDKDGSGADGGAGKNEDQGGDGDTEGVAEAVKSAITEALKPISDRLDTVEKRTRPGSQQDDGDVPASMKNDAEYDAFGRKIKLED